jgi:hypothetical protein
MFEGDSGRVLGSESDWRLVSTVEYHDADRFRIGQMLPLGMTPRTDLAARVVIKNFVTAVTRRDVHFDRDTNLMQEAW